METLAHYSSKDIQMDRAQLATQWREMRAKTRAEQIKSATLAFKERANEIIKMLDRGSECRFEEYHPASQTQNENDQLTDQLPGIGIMLSEDSPTGSQDPNLYLVHPSNSLLSSTRLSKRTTGPDPSSCMPKTSRMSVISTLNSLVSLLEDTSVPTMQTGILATGASETSSSSGRFRSRIASFFKRPSPRES